MNYVASGQQCCTGCDEKDYRVYSGRVLKSNEHECRVFLPSWSTCTSPLESIRKCKYCFHVFSCWRDKYTEIIRLRCIQRYVTCNEFWALNANAHSQINNFILCDSVLGAINQLTKNLACEWATDSIRVNAVSPWAVNTQISPPVLFFHNFNMLNNSVHILTIFGSFTVTF